MYLNISTDYYSVIELYRKYKHPTQKLMLDNPFSKAQWELNQQRRFIESILLGIPVPSFYFCEDKKGNLIVGDGKQRLIALFRFIDNEYSLDNLKFFKEGNGKTFSELDAVYQNRLEDLRILSHRIHPSVSEMIKTVIFERVNS